MLKLKIENLTTCFYDHNFKFVFGSTDVCLAKYCRLNCRSVVGSEYLTLSIAFFHFP